MLLAFPAVFTLVLTLVAAVLLISELLRPDLIALIVMVILGLAGIVSPPGNFFWFQRIGGDNPSGDFDHFRRSPSDRRQSLAWKIDVWAEPSIRISPGTDNHAGFCPDISVYE